MKLYSDKQLNLPTTWFTGKEWADGTAEEYFRREYKDAVKLQQSEHAKRDDRGSFFSRWEKVIHKL